MLDNYLEPDVNHKSLARWIESAWDFRGELKFLCGFFWSKIQPTGRKTDDLPKDSFGGVAVLWRSASSKSCFAYGFDWHRLTGFSGPYFVDISSSKVGNMLSSSQTGRFTASDLNTTNQTAWWNNLTRWFQVVPPPKQKTRMHLQLFLLPLNLASKMRRMKLFVVSFAIWKRIWSR